MPVRWGILSTGSIAHAFARGLQRVSDAELVAVGSRRAETAEAFGDAFGVPRRHATYEALSEDDAIDIVYVATPHVFHQDNTEQCLRAGKAVLCEKPLAMNADEAQAMVDCARDTGQLLMEGMWTRFFPVVEQVRTWVEDGAIGAPQLMQFSMSTRQARDPESRLFDPALGGGTLLDLGVYPVSFASMLCGRPDAVAAQATIGPTEVDEQATALLQYDDGPHVTFALSMRTEMPVRGVVAGTEGRIEIDRPWFNPTRATLHRFGDDEPVPVEEPHENGFEYEAAAVTRLVSEGASESAVMPLGESVSVMETLDRLRAAIGLEYPDRTAA